MKKMLSTFGVNCIWHFTDRSNIQSIKDSGGLLSLRQCINRGLKIPSPGGNQWSHDADTYNGVDDYIHLAFLSDHPMQFRATQDGRIPNPVWIKIKLDVLDFDGVRFTSDVSNKAGVQLLNSEQAAVQLDLEVLFKRLDWKNAEIKARRLQAVKSEILVPRFISVDMILGSQNG